MLAKPMTVLLTVTGLLTISTIGCGKGGGLEKVTVVGDITYDGHKILNGSIRFEPVANTAGPVSTAPIVNGHYEAKYKGGVPVGTHRVVLQALVLEDIGSIDGASGGDGGDMLSGLPNRNAAKLPIRAYWHDGVKQFLPPQFNQDSALSITVTGEQSPQVKDFHIDSGAG
jgi:hypothetical protein